MRTTTKYEAELQRLKSWDEVQFTSSLYGFDFIETAGHGYLVVPRDNPMFYLAKDICKYGFSGQHAVYLEEDCEAGQFLKSIGAIK